MLQLSFLCVCSKFYTNIFFKWTNFREQSEELRTEQTRRRQNEICTERAAQLCTRQVTQRQKEEEEQLFAQLWESDRQAKEEREGQDAQRQRQSNLQQLVYLRVQMEAAEQQREQAKQLKEEEALLLVGEFSL